MSSLWLTYFESLTVFQEACFIELAEPVVRCHFPYIPKEKKKKEKEKKEKRRRRRSRKSNSKGMFEVFPNDYVHLLFRLLPTWSMPKEQVPLKANFCLSQGIGDMTETSLYKQVPALLWETVLYCQ